MKQGSKTLFFIAVFCTFLTLPKSILAVEYIEAFDSTITVNQDTSLSIQESIVYFTDQVKHGIFRYIPYLLRSGADVKITRISDISIVDEFDNPIQFVQNTQNEFVAFKIGDPHSTFQGKKTYVIRYRVSQALERFTTHDELYWDITGEGWEFPIRSSRASIISAFAPISKIDCFSGLVGNDNGQCVSTLSASDSATFTYGETLGFGENVTIAVAFDRPNQLIYPSIRSAVEKKWIKRASYIVAMLPFMLLLLIWSRYGRDYVFISPNVFEQGDNHPKRKKRLFETFRVPFVYEPLSISPGEAGVMLDEKADANDVIAEILELARKKYLSIKFVEKEGLFGKTDYELLKLKKDDSKLNNAQRYLFNHLFSSQDKVMLSTLKGSFYLHFEQTKRLLEESVKSHHYFTRPISTSRGVGVAAALVVNCAVGVLLFLLCFLVQSFDSFLLFGLGLPISMLLGWNLVQKTALGTNAMLQAKGLKETLRLAKWRDEIKEKHLFIEAIIPYSIALGVIDKLSKDMDDLGIKPPEYINHGFTRGLTLNAFSHDFSSSATSSLSYNPASSSSSSGSGFSGGSSGGGGGGGGGGSW